MARQAGEKAQSANCFPQEHQDPSLIPSIHRKARFDGMSLQSQIWGGRHRRVSGAFGIASLVEEASSRFSERCLVPKVRQRAIGEELIHTRINQPTVTCSHVGRNRLEMAFDPK